MPDKKVSVTRLSDIQVGEYYHIKGSDSGGMPIPPQICRVTSKPTRTTAFGVPSVSAEVMAKVGEQLVRYDTRIDLWSVNVKEGGAGTLTGHGFHDRELIRMVHPDELKRFLGDESYNEIIAQGDKKPELLVATKFGAGI